MKIQHTVARNEQRGMFTFFLLFDWKRITGQECHEHPFALIGYATSTISALPTQLPSRLSTALLTSHISFWLQGGKRFLLQSLSLVIKSRCDCFSPGRRGCFYSSSFCPALLPHLFTATERVRQHGTIERQHMEPGCAYLYSIGLC